MNIVILSGGTGSIALQKGLHSLIGRQLDGINIKVIVNAYDNGLSTGAVRQVMNGKILGPSDVRKNQTTRLELENPNSPWLKFLNIRFTKPSDEVKDYCYQCIDSLHQGLVTLGDIASTTVPSFFGDSLATKINKTQLIREAVDAYFKSPIATKIDYNDFSLANIIYAGFAAANKNSLRAAASIMAKIMEIEDNVILNDDTSLFLGAVTKSGKRITDEGDIVSWGSYDDPIVDVFFTDAQGNDARPVLCYEAMAAIEDADLIILSSGTQWSSLIPTYESVGFDTAIANSKAEIVMVMNRQPDKDSPGQSASDIIRILTERYFGRDRLKVILDSNGHDLMRYLDDDAKSRVQSYVQAAMGKPSDMNAKTHDPYALADAVGMVYFDKFIGSDCYVFDYDDTLVGRGNVFPKSSNANIKNIAYIKSNNSAKVAICTGNSIKAISLKSSNDSDHPYTANTDPLNITVYADGGVNKYTYIAPIVQNDDEHIFERKQEFIKCVNESAAFTTAEADKIIDILREHNISLSKIENRGNAMIAIRPIESDYRPMVLELVRLIVNMPGVIVKASGRTTIEISKHNLSKVDAIFDLQREGNKIITYVGDELDSGNDSVVKNIQGVQCLHVKNPVHTAFFTTVLVRYLNSRSKQ